MRPSARLSPSDAAALVARAADGVAELPALSSARDERAAAARSARSRADAAAAEATAAESAARQAEAEEKAAEEALSALLHSLESGLRLIESSALALRKSGGDSSSLSMHETFVDSIKSAMASVRTSAPPDYEPPPALQVGPTSGTTLEEVVLRGRTASIGGGEVAKTPRWATNLFGGVAGLIAGRSEAPVRFQAETAAPQPGASFLDFAAAAVSGAPAKQAGDDGAKQSPSRAPPPASKAAPLSYSPPVPATPPIAVAPLASAPSLAEERVRQSLSEVKHEAEPLQPAAEPSGPVAAAPEPSVVAAPPSQPAELDQDALAKNAMASAISKVMAAQACRLTSPAASPASPSSPPPSSSPAQTAAAVAARRRSAQLERRALFSGDESDDTVAKPPAGPKPPPVAAPPPPVAPPPRPQPKPPARAERAAQPQQPQPASAGEEDWFGALTGSAWSFFAGPGPEEEEGGGALLRRHKDRGLDDMAEY